jgi:hypothetical protein
MVFHVFHFAVPALLQPGFEARRLLFEEAGFADAAEIKAELPRGLLYKLGMGCFGQQAKIRSLAG